MWKERQGLGVATGLIVVVIGGIVVMQGQLGKTITGKATGTQASGCNDMGPLPPLPEAAEYAVDNGISPNKQRTKYQVGDVADAIPGEYVLKLCGLRELPFTVDTVDMAEVDPSVLAALDVIDAGEIELMLDAKPSSAVGQARLGGERTYTFQSDSTMQSVLASLRDLDGVEWVEPVYRADGHAKPDDKYWGYQWNMSSMGLPNVGIHIWVRGRS